MDKDTKTFNKKRIRRAIEDALIEDTTHVIVAIFTGDYHQSAYGISVYREDDLEEQKKEYNDKLKYDVVGVIDLCEETEPQLEAIFKLVK